MRCVILSARRYSFTDAASDRDVNGFIVDYVDPEPPATSEPAKKGLYVLQVTTQKLELWDKLTVLPGLYHVDFAMRPGKNNRPTLSLTDLEFVESVKIDGSGNGKMAARS